MHTFLFDLISGCCVGIELYTGDDLEGNDKFAMSLDLFILRVTYIYS